jgi:adenosylcobinamide-phosphate synthase
VTARGAAAGLVLDRLVGEPLRDPHPVAVLGQVLGGLERRLWRDERGAGVVHAAAGAGIGLAVGAAIGSTAVAVTLATAGRLLGEEAMVVERALEAGQLEVAREALGSLVGRDRSSLDDAGIARAAVESVAENTVDAVVAPALWGAVAGAPGAVAHRVVNTLDAMVGYRSARYERFGWASARLDDLAAWVPARVTAALVAAVRPGAGGAVWRAVRGQAPAHPSPNAGVAEAAFAAALGLRLGGELRYGDRSERRPALGDGRAPRAGDIRAAVRLAADVQWALAAGLGAVALARRP